MTATVKNKTKGKAEKPNRARQSASTDLPLMFVPVSNQFLSLGRDFFFDTADLGAIRREAELSDIDEAALAGAARDLEVAVKGMFGDQATIELRPNDDVDLADVPFVIEAKYGLDHDPSDDDWARHSSFLRAYVEKVPAALRRQIRLIRTA
ncbi:MAG: hypothetical protein ABJF01_19820 [bacterium]